MRPGNASGHAVRMKLEIRPLDPADAETVDAVQAVRVAVTATDLPDYPPPCPYPFRVALRNPRTHHRTEWFVATVGGGVAGYLSLSLPLQDNVENAEVTIAVHPAYRRRGVGRALHGHGLGLVRELGRMRWSATTVAPLPGGPYRAVAGGAFAEAMGASFALEEIGRRLVFAAADQPALDALHAEARARSTGYRVVRWRDRTPAEYTADRAYLSARMASDAPHGELHWEKPRIDTARIREAEDASVAQRLRVYATGALHEQTGRLVAVTMIGLEHSSPAFAGQYLTIVDPAHRGHRLGALIKLENLRHVQAHEPQLCRIDTTNADSNAHMLSINDAMGFRPVDRWLHWQQEVSRG